MSYADIWKEHAWAVKTTTFGDLAGTNIVLTFTGDGGGTDDCRVESNGTSAVWGKKVKYQDDNTVTVEHVASAKTYTITRTPPKTATDHATLDCHNGQTGGTWTAEEGG